MKHIPTFEQFVNEAFMSSDINKTVQLLNSEVGNSPGYLFFAEDDEIKAFDTLWANKKYKEALDMLAAAHDIDATNFKEVQKFINESANEGFDAKYWEDYHDKSPKITQLSGMVIQHEVEAEVEEWNDNNEEGPSNEVKPAGEKKVIELAKQFAKAKGWISSDVIQAMIAQES